MGIESLRQYLKDIPGADKLSMTYSPTGNQVFHLGDKSIEVSPTASNEEIRQALITPTVPTANTTVTVKPQMANALQGFGQKLSKLKHDAEFDAGKLAARIDALTSRKDAAVAQSGKYLDQHEKDVADIEAFVKEIETATNGGPA